MTAEQAFVDADLNHDGRLSFEEFQKWYSNTNGQEADKDQETETGEDTQVSEGTPTLQEVRDLLRLGSFSVEDVFSQFADASEDDGSLDYDSFVAVFKRFVLSRQHISSEDEDFAFLLVDRIFNIFADTKRRVDFCDLASGLSIVCGGSSGDRVAAAFALYDFNGDGYISLDEMTRFLTCVFKVLFEVSWLNFL